MAIKTIIIDDDEFMLNHMNRHLSLNYAHVDVLALAANGAEGIKAIRNYQPNLIFLDVEMPDMTGLEMLAKLEEINFQTIFITAHSQYAISAIRFNALDYLLKPIDFNDLRKALKRYDQRTKADQNVSNIKHAIENLATPVIENKKFLLPLRSGQIRPPLKEIISIQASGSYCIIQLIKEKQFIVTRRIGEFEEVLQSRGFFRCHKSYLVNRTHVNTIGSNSQLILSNGHAIPVSRRRKMALKDWLATAV